MSILIAIGLAMTRACKGCVWWQELAETSDGTLMGECRAYPPRPEMTSEKEVSEESENVRFVPVWPMTEADEWCGGFTSESMGELPTWLFGQSSGKMN